MRVQATEGGQYRGGWRDKGDTFTLQPKQVGDKTYSAEEQFAEAWMRKLDGGKPAPKTKGPASSKPKS